jgi:hypothetical protein
MNDDYSLTETEIAQDCTATGPQQAYPQDGSKQFQTLSNDLSAPSPSRLAERHLEHRIMVPFRRLPSFMIIVQPGESDQFPFSKSFHHFACEVRLALMSVLAMVAMVFSFNGYLHELLGEYML